MHTGSTDKSVVGQLVAPVIGQKEKVVMLC